MPRRLIVLFTALCFGFVGCADSTSSSDSETQGDSSQKRGPVSAPVSNGKADHSIDFKVDKEIEFGQPVDSEFSKLSYHSPRWHRYTFEVTEQGSPISLFLNSSTFSKIDTAIYVADPNGEVIAQDNNYGSNNAAQIEDLTVESSGTYEIYIAGFSSQVLTTQLFAVPYTVELHCEARGWCKSPAAPDQNEAEAKVLKNLRMQTLESDSSTQVVRFVGKVKGDQQSVIEDGQRLDLTIYASDGASNSEFTVEGSMAFSVSGVGGFVSDEIDISELMPWRQLTVEVDGEANQHAVDNKYTFEPGDAEGRLVESKTKTMVDVLSRLQLINYQSDGPNSESFLLLGDVRSEATDYVRDGHTLDVEIYASDGASNTEFRIEDTLTYHVQGVGGYTSGGGSIDTSQLLPWRRLTIRVFGTLRGMKVDQTFHFSPGDEEAQPVDE